MANTSLAQQLRNLAAPQTSILLHRKTRPSLLFDPSEAAEIDRATFYDIGVSGLNELKEINEVFEEFRSSLFDETSKNFERAIESADVNSKLNVVIKKFLYLASPYFLLKPTQKALEWLIVRFHVHDYNADELICSALPYHGTRLFARLIQVFNLKDSHDQWQWLYPLQKKGIPLSKTALFNHCASEINFLKMICDFTVDAVKIFDQNTSKLTTLFGFYSTTIIGSIQSMSELTELHLTHMLPSVMFGLTLDCVDYCASSFMIISAILIKYTFQERLRNKLTEKIAKVDYPPLRKSMVLLLNIMYQSEELDKVSLTYKTIRNLAANADWFIPTLMNFISSGRHTNIFYMLLIRDGLNLLSVNADDKQMLMHFIEKLVNSCRVDDACAEKMIRIIVDRAQKTYDVNCCELLKNLENQYPDAWDSVVALLFEGEPSESLSHVLGFTSATSQVDIFLKLNHPIAAIRAETIKTIANNVHSFKVKYIESSLRARWNDEDPSVIEAMFLLPINLRFFSTEIFEKLLLKCWLEPNGKWNSLLIKILRSLKTNEDLNTHSTKYTIILLPFLVCLSKEIQNLILKLDLPIFRVIKNEIDRNNDVVISEALRSCKNIPPVDDLIEVFRSLPHENVHIFTTVLLLNFAYECGVVEEKSKILTFFFEEIFPVKTIKVKLETKMEWNDEKLRKYYSHTIQKLPKEIAYKFFNTIVLQTAHSAEISCFGWCEFADDNSNLIALLYKYLSQCSNHDDDVCYNNFISPLIQKLFDTLPGQLGFLCNMCVLYQHEPQIHFQSLKMIEKLLNSSKEGYSWALSINSDSIVVPCILISLNSCQPHLRRQTMKIIEILIQSIGLALSKKITYAEFLKHLHQFDDEIILDRDQLPSRMYAFLSQDDDIQSLLPVSVRYITKNFYNSLLECCLDERTPLRVVASLLQVFEYFKDSFVIKKLVSLVSRIVLNNNFLNDASSQIVRAFVDKFNVAAIEVLYDKNVFAFIDYCVQNYAVIKIRTENGVVNVGAVLLQKFADDLFNALDDVRQKFFLHFVLRICSTNEVTDLISVANSFMKKITLNCELAVPYLTAMKTVSLVKAKSATNKRRSVNDEPSGLYKPEWTMGVALLELVQNKKKIFNCHLLIPPLFDVLRKCCEVDDHLPMEYAKQVCLSCLLNCSQKIVAGENTEQLESLFNVELIVNCIRMSPNPQTHHHALLLLAHCATFASSQVLHNVMAIFTFMGSSVLRQDDAFSFQIISNILETIVPLLVNAENDGSVSSSAIVSVLRVFAASIPDIPDHRRIPLLLKLMKILQDGEFTHTLIILSLGCCSKSTIGGKATVIKYVEVFQELLLLLPPHISLSTFVKIITYVNGLPHTVDEKNKNQKEKGVVLFNVKKHTNKELSNFKYLLLNFTATAISGYKFIQQISRLDNDKLQGLESHFKGIIEQILLCLKGILGFAASSKHISAKYSKVMISQSLEILNKANALLTSETFIAVIKELIDHECLLVQRKSLEFLNWRLQAAKEGSLKDEFSSKSLISLIPHLMKIVGTISAEHANSENAFDLKINQQISLISLKLLAKHCSASGNMQPFKPVLTRLIALQGTKMNDNVLACLVLCVAELVSSLKVLAIDSLPKFIPNLITLFGPYKDENIFQNEVILLSIITALHKVIETLPNFLSPYLESILFEITRITALLNKCENAENKTEEKLSGLTYKLKAIRQKIAAEVPSRVLLPSISSSFANSCDTGNFNSIKPLLDILVHSFPKNSQFTGELISLFLAMFDFRCTSKSATNDEVNLIEQYCVEALCNIVLKCSESTFRPFYHKLYDWGVIASKELAKKDRILTYYKILNSLSKNLKSIFVLFASNFIRNAVELLDKNNISKNEESCNKSYINSPEKCILLVDSILKTLHNVFKYDTVKFLTKDRFNVLMEPLVNQVENTIGDYKTRSADIIIPCIARFAAATSDDSLWKQFNYLILLKTRHSSPEVRLTALETICTFATHLGDNFLPFLPETVPFLAELLEDENEIVERQTHKAVQKLEQILEEPIQKYF